MGAQEGVVAPFSSFPPPPPPPPQNGLALEFGGGSIYPAGGQNEAPAGVGNTSSSNPSTQVSAKALRSKWWHLITRTILGSWNNKRVERLPAAPSQAVANNCDFVYSLIWSLCLSAVRWVSSGRRSVRFCRRFGQWRVLGGQRDPETAPCLQHPLPLQRPRPAADVRGTRGFLGFIHQMILETTNCDV